MTDGVSPAEVRLAQFPAGRARWLTFAGLAVLTGLGAWRAYPGASDAGGIAAASGGAIALAGGALLLWRRRPLLPYAAIATAGIAMIGNGTASNVVWILVCLIAGWCTLFGGRRDSLAYWAAMMVLFAVEWTWVRHDYGWFAWLAGTTLTVLAGLTLRREQDLVAQLRAAQAELAERTRAQERNRIARELHDIIGHTLTVSLLHIMSARLSVKHDPADADRALAEAERLGRESLAEVRLAVGMLHQDGDAASTLPLPGAADLPALIERYRSAGAEVTASVDGDTGRLPATTGLALYRILQESLTNAAKHAPGSPANVSVDIGADGVTLTVISAGAPGPVGRGLGIGSMRERAESIGGRCEAGPNDQGWLVRATLPLTEAPK